MSETEAFLNVTKSATSRRWVDRLDHNARRMAGAIGEQFELSDVLSRILAAREVAPDAVDSYLNPAIRDLMPDPSSMQDMDALADRLSSAIIQGEKIALFGDYDVDGASSCALMSRYLNHFNVPNLVHIPDRIFEGYGPNIAAIDDLKANGATLLITLDCGSTSVEALTHAKSIGLEVLILDHHNVSENSVSEVAKVDAHVNPNRPDDISALGYLCAAGVTFMALVATNRALRKKSQPEFPALMSLLDLVALATICDVVPLKGLNRAFVLRGLEQVQTGANRGIRALSLAARQTQPATPYTLGYVIGPRINAGGRIGDASLGAKLLSLEDEAQSFALAAQLDELNTQRQAMEAEAVEQAIASAEVEIGQSEGPDALILSSSNWHPGVIGLIAARVKERFHRPTFAIALRPDGKGVGSGRSIAGVDIGAAILGLVKEATILKGGGHAMAAGITLEQDQIPAFRAQLNAALHDQTQIAIENRAINIDAAITARTATNEFIADFNRAGPFGAGNPNPNFVLPAHRVRYASVVGKGGHVRATLASADGAKLQAIAFRAATSPVGDLLLNAKKTDQFHFCGNLTLNHWQGRETPQLRIEDIAVPSKI